jgi:superfamily I DNA and/or RNA helicase
VNSHKVIRNLLDEVVVASGDKALPTECIQKVSDKEDDLPGLRFTTDNATFLDALHSDCRIGGGTAWFWARPDAARSVDVLFVDEAAQMSLANVLAVSQAAQSIVLLGDPRQLEQPVQGSHPDGVDVSSLDHILGPQATVPADRGLFLAETWRLHPLICSFNSELFYDGRLRPRPGLERQMIKSKGKLSGAGLRYLSVAHEGNQERIPGARIRTVEKFQGREAPIVIYSMTTSTHSDAPRGMEFLYSANRLNVATSRAKCICIVVASPRLFEAECRTPRQMQLANAFCRYLELATHL